MDDPSTSQSSSSAFSSSKGKECAAFWCSNTFYGPDGLRTHYHFLSFLKTHREEKRQHGKDGFSVTESTVIFSDHLKTADIKRTLTGRWDLVKSFTVF